ncbi:long-chain fatty acid--CoA ligase [Pseudonocardia sp. MCCB 268]|nr:long-chain fatty acid--CoA ligase [Pseudonocardia cytotoxica]
MGGQPAHAVPRLPDDLAITAAVTDDGWFRPGDWATVDDDGRYRSGGRGGDIVKVGGENVSSTEVEAVPATGPGRSSRVAAGAPDPVLDETVAAVYVPAGAAPSE